MKNRLTIGLMAFFLLTIVNIGYGTNGYSLKLRVSEILAGSGQTESGPMIFIENYVPCVYEGYVNGEPEPGAHIGEYIYIHGNRVFLERDGYYYFESPIYFTKICQEGGSNDCSSLYCPPIDL